MTKALAALRRFVVATRHVPILASTYEAVFDRLAERSLARLRAPAGVSLYRRDRDPSDRRTFEAGITDVDLLAILRDDPDARRAGALAHALDRAVLDAGTFVPVVRDVHAFTESEYSWLAHLASSLVAVTRATSIDGPGIPEPPRLRDSASARRIAALELASFTTLRATRQLVEEPGPVGETLATHALRKAARARASLVPDRFVGEQAKLDVYESAVSALHRLGQVWPRECADSERPDPLDHPGVGSLKGPIERWSRPLLGLAALRSVALVADSPAASDVRLVVVLDPGHTAAASTLASIAAHRRRVPPPAFEPGTSPLRLHVLPESSLDRVWPGSTASLEPLLRGAAFALGRPLPPPAIDRPMLARNLAVGMILTSSALRERASRPPDPDRLLRVRGIVEGLLPSVECFLDDRHLVASSAFRETGIDEAARANERLHAAIARTVPRLVALARPLFADPESISGS